MLHTMAKNTAIQISTSPVERSKTPTQKRALEELGKMKRKPPRIQKSALDLLGTKIMKKEMKHRLKNNATKGTYGKVKLQNKKLIESILIRTHSLIISQARH